MTSTSTGSTEWFDAMTVSAEGHVVSAVINRPAIKNAINDDVIDGLSAAIDLAERRHARALVIRGSAGCFCAGADLVQVAGLRGNPARLEEFALRLGQLFNRLENGPFATVAVVEGYAMAGGCELMLACDVVIAANSARIGDCHLEYGMVPAAGGAVRLSKYLPRARANFLLLSGELLSGRQAEDWGLVTIAVDPDALDRTATRMIEQITRHSGEGLAAVKRMISNTRRLSQVEALTLERAVFLRHAASHDMADALGAYLQHRDSIFD